MRNYSGVDTSTRSKFYDDQQHLDPIAEYDDELDIDYVAEEDNYDNETVDEEEYQYFDNDQFVIENRKRYVKPTKSREMYVQPTRANYLYKKKQIEHSTDRPLRKPSTKMSLGSPLSPATSKIKVEPTRWNKPNNPISSYQRVPKTKKSDGPMNALNSLNVLREKMLANLPSLSKPQSSNTFTPDPTVPAILSHHNKPRRRNVVATEQIHHDSGDGPRVSESFKMNLSELLKITDESNFSGSVADNEIVANLVNDINSMQMDNMRKIGDMDRQKQEMDQYMPKSLNFDSFRQQLERKHEPDQLQSSSGGGYQAFNSPGFPHNIFESFNIPMKKNSSTQTQLGVGDTYSSEHVLPNCEKYDEACGQDDNDNQNWNADDVSNLVSSSKEDLSELRNLQKTKRMICELINKEIEKIAKMKNLDMSVSRRFLLQDRESLSCTEDCRKTRLDSLKNLQNEIKKLITLETVDE